MRPLIRFLRQVHLAIGLVLGLHFCLIATTGALYTFEPELKAISLRQFQATSGDVGPDLVAAEVARAYPEWKKDGLQFPSPECPFYRAYLITGENPEESYFWTDVFVDPGTGKILGEIDNGDWNLDGVLQVAIGLHIRLCAGEPGRLFVDFSIAFFVLTLLVGVVLWWPGIRRLRHGFTMRLRRNQFVALYDWHRVTGILATPLLLLMALTGLPTSFRTVPK